MSLIFSICFRLFMICRVLWLEMEFMFMWFFCFSEVEILLVLAGKYRFLFLFVRVVVVYCRIINLEFVLVFCISNLGMVLFMFVSERQQCWLEILLIFEVVRQVQFSGRAIGCLWKLFLLIESFLFMMIGLFVMELSLILRVFWRCSQVLWEVLCI